MHTHHEHHHADVSEKTISGLIWSFVINMLLSVVEFVGGIIGGSVALIGDALHNTSDAFSILIAVLAYKIGRKKSNRRFTYGFKRAEIIGGFVNLILLFVSALYLLVEGIEKLLAPEQINGHLIIWISVLALIIDTVTAKLSHHDADHNTNMKMLFLHNLADALGSVGVIVSGLCVVYFDVAFVDGLVALMIAVYMIFQSVISFPKLVRILMDAAPECVDVNQVRERLLKIRGVRDVHHIHVWCVSENNIALDCHVVATDIRLMSKIKKTLHDEFDISHSTIQMEDGSYCDHCCL